jgi:flavin-binding protein dodecin
MREATPKARRRRHPGSPGQANHFWTTTANGSGREWHGLRRPSQLIGTSTQSWEDAVSVAVKAASGTIRDLRVAEVVEQDIHIGEDGALTYRTNLQVSVQVRRQRVER